MNPTNEMFLGIWEVLDDALTDNKKVETAERLLKVFEDFGAEPEELIGLNDEDKNIKIAVETVYQDFFISEEEGEDDYDEEDNEEY